MTRFIWKSIFRFFNSLKELTNSGKKIKCNLNMIPIHLIWWERKSTYLSHESGDINNFYDNALGWSCNTPDHFMLLGNQDKPCLRGPIGWSTVFTVTLFDHQQQPIISPWNSLNVRCLTAPNLIVSHTTYMMQNNSIV